MFLLWIKHECNILISPRRRHVFHAGHQAASAGDEFPGVWWVGVRNMWLLSGRTWVWVPGPHIMTAGDEWKTFRVSGDSGVIFHLLLYLPHLWFRLLCLLVLPLFRLHNHQEVRSMSVSPPAGHRHYPPHHLGHEGLHAGTLRHQSKAISAAAIFITGLKPGFVSAHMHLL